MPTARDLKKQLVAQGFQVYRTLHDRVVLAERVRENLIMDSGVSAVCNDAGLAVQLVFRAQSADFPGETSDQLLARARGAAHAAAQGGYQELTTRVTPVHDPTDKSRVLDTWYEVVLERGVADEAELFDALRQATSYPKTAHR